MVGDGLPAGEECEGVVVEAAEFFPDGDELPGVVDGAVELPAVADDAVVLHQPVYVLRGHLCYFSTSKWWKALRYPSRLRRMVIQESPACALSSTRNSKRVLSSVTGRPHSSSWYLVYRGSVPAQPQREFMMSCMCLLFGSKSQS